MFSAEDTPANPSAKQGKGKAKKTRDTSSPGSPKPFANYDPDTRSWKTYPAISLWDSEPYKASWPRSGMTLDGIAYQLPPCAPRTYAIEYSLSQHRGPNSHGLWPTATTEDHATRYSQGGMPLGMAARLWPTPTTQKIEHPNAVWNQTNRRVASNGSTHSMNLADHVQLWPTPVTHKMAGGSGSRENLKQKLEKGEITQEEFQSMSSGNGGRLNPMWVEWLMGFPLGWTDLEDSETQSSHKSPNTSEGS